MKINKLLFVCLAFLAAFLIFPDSLKAQNALQKEEIEEYETKAKDIVTFFEYVLNTLGNKSTSARDKDVIITESYTKIFRDEKVQIEDDLDEERDVITYKNVQAYLKDVDFFFKGVKFDFEIEDISHYESDKGELFFKVSLTRNLKGIGIEGDSINNTEKRYVEINLNPESKDLKIESIYTNEFNQKEAITRWWRDLSYEWKAIFKRKVGLIDSANYEDLKKIVLIKDLDISNNRYIQNIAPLDQLTGLTRLDMSGTSINNLKAIRNLTRLQELNISNTQVDNLEPLKYATELRYLEFKNTPVVDLTTIARLAKLQTLNASGTQINNLEIVLKLTKLKNIQIARTQIYDLEPLSLLNTLEELNVTSTNVRSLKSLGALENLKILTADSTAISSLEPLGDIKSLEKVSVNYTEVTDLSPLSGLPKLDHIYCDATTITKADADEFMQQNPGVLVIFESESLKNWWMGLPVSWKEIFERSMTFADRSPTKEELAKLTSMDSINLSGNMYIQSIEPLTKLTKLQKVILSNTPLFDLKALSEMRSIQYLDISHTDVVDFSPLASLTRLRTLKANQTEMSSLEALTGLDRLRLLEVDNTLVNEVHVQELARNNSGCLVIFKSEYLKAWWNDLDENWKNIFLVQTTISSTPTTEQLHKLIELPVVQFSEVDITDLTPLRNFLNIKELRISGTAISDLSPLQEFKYLETLQITKGPVSDLSVLKGMANLRNLDISNTPVSDLDTISKLMSIESLNCSGTQIKKLNDLDNLANLTSLDCSNTNVKRLDEVVHLNIKTLKCYNTRISGNRVEEFKQSNPDCNVIYY